MTSLMVNFGGLVLMAAIVAWFWWPGSSKNQADNSEPSQHHH
ncbi:hypothetical protein [Marinobacter changyiensis]|nr:hypothetical protein [Marinobacter changyiensis]